MSEISESTKIKRKGRLPKVKEVEVYVLREIQVSEEAIRVLAQLIYELWKEGKIKWEKR